MVSESEVSSHTKIYLTLLFENKLEFWKLSNSICQAYNVRSFKMGARCDYTLSITFESVSKVHIYIEALHC